MFRRKQCCAFGSGSGSSISSESGSRSRVLMTQKNLQKYHKKILFSFFVQKIAISLSLGVHKGHPSYRRSLQPSKENIHYFKT
jgi:hypothetical protein